MEDLFKIYIDRLESGEEELIKETFPSTVMEIFESELAFKYPIYFEGKVTMTTTSLLLTFSVETIATLPCAICNGEASVKIKIINFHHMEKLEDVKGGIFNFKNLLRETVLLEIPLKAECHEGNCPERINMVKYMKKKGQEGEFYQPFADL